MSNSSSANLCLINSHSGQYKEYILSNQDPNSIGRSPECKIVLDAQEFVTVSRVHVIINFRENSQESYWEITDNNTTNGTLINGAKITDPYVLKSGDRILLGLRGPEFIFTINSLIPTVLEDINPDETTLLEVSQEVELYEDNIEDSLILVEDNSKTTQPSIVTEIIDNEEKKSENLNPILATEIISQKDSQAEINKNIVATEIIGENPLKPDINQQILATEIINQKSAEDKNFSSQPILATEIIGEKSINLSQNTSENIILPTEIITEKPVNLPQKNPENIILATEIIGNNVNVQPSLTIDNPPELLNTQILDKSSEITKKNNLITPSINQNNSISLSKQSIWSLFNFQLCHSIETTENNIQCLAISQDNQFVVGGCDKYIKIWNINNSQEISIFSGHNMTVNTIAISHNNKLIVSGSNDKLIKLWSIENQTEIASFSGHQMGINGVAISNDNQLIASAGIDNIVNLWSCEEKTKIVSFSGHKMRVNTVAISHDNKLIASAGIDKTIKLWNVDKLSEEKTIKTSFYSPINSLFFHPNNQYLLCLLPQEQKIVLLDLHSELELFYFQIPPDFSFSTTISYDGCYFASVVGNKILINSFVN